MLHYNKLTALTRIQLIAMPFARHAATAHQGTAATAHQVWPSFPHLPLFFWPKILSFECVENVLSVLSVQIESGADRGESRCESECIECAKYAEGAVCVVCVVVLIVCSGVIPECVWNVC